MTNEEAKLVLDNARPQTKEIDRQFYDDEDLNNALDMAIKSLEQQPCEDCVSRAEVIKALNNHWLSGSCSRRIIDEQIDKVKSLPPVTPTQRWIPVSERLPEVGEKVLCQCQANIYEVLKLTVDGWFYDNKHCYMSGFVIAWMPLPKPYEEKRGNENG